MSLVISNNTKVIITTNVNSFGDILTGINNTNSFVLTSILIDSIKITENKTSSESINLANFIDSSSNLSNSVISSKISTITFDKYVDSSIDFKQLLSIYTNSTISNNILPFTIVSKLPKLFGVIVLLDNIVAFTMNRCFIESINVDMNITDIVKSSFSIKSFNSNIHTHTSKINTTYIDVSIDSIIGNVSILSSSSYCLGKHIKATISHSNSLITLPITSSSLSNTIQVTTYNSASALGSSSCYEHITGISGNSVSCNISVYNRISKYTTLIAEFLSYNTEQTYVNLALTLVSNSTDILTINLIGCQLDYSSNFSSGVLTDAMELKLSDPLTSNNSSIIWYL